MANVQQCRGQVASPAVLKEVDSGPAIVVCNTCRHSQDARDDAEGVLGGARLTAALRSVKSSDPHYDGIAIQEMPCLFACSDHCTVHIRAPDKIGYVLGRFAPDEEAARAILEYAVHHAASEHGKVPFSKWPEGVKGHFITRIPPAGFLVQG